MTHPAVTWEWKRLMLSDPGKRGWLALMAFPLLTFLPWKSLLFESQTHGLSAIVGLYAFVTATSIASSDARSANGVFWLFQKGVPLEEYVLARFLTQCTVGVAAAVTMALFAFVASWIYGEASRWSSLSFALVGGSLVLLTCTVLLFLAALRVDRRIELMLPIVMLSFLQDLFLMNRPMLVQRVAHYVLPPFRDSFDLPAALLARNWNMAAGAFTHLLIFMVLCVVISTNIYARWRPAQETPASA